MLNRVKLSYFQQHVALEVRLDEGLTAIRGRNEAGKSTLLRGICYALFGAKAMPDTLDALVSWGPEGQAGFYPASKLKAEVEFTMDGVVYTVTRGKSGAEVNYEGGKVTGQNEVTAFVCRLLRADAVAAPRLMLSNQNEIRGALEAGPKETTALIERLSEFSQLDDVLELIQEKLTLGSTAHVEAAIATAEAQLSSAQELAVEPDLQSFADAFATHQTALGCAEADQQEAQEALDTATAALNDGKVAQAERQAVVTQISKLSGRLDEIEKELEPLAGAVAPDNVEGRVEAMRAQITGEEQRAAHQRAKDRIIEIADETSGLLLVKAPVGAEAQFARLRKRITDIEGMAALKAKYAKVEPYLGPDNDCGWFKGTVAELEALIEKQAAAVTEGHRVAAASEAQATLLRQQITDGACGFCGQDFSEVPAVKTKNAELDAQAVAAETAAKTRRESADQASRDLEELRTILGQSKPVMKVLDVVGDVAELWSDVLPPCLRWIGPEVEGEVEDPKALQAQIDALDAAQKAYDRAETKLEALNAEKARLLVGLPETLPAPADTPALKRQIRELERQQADYLAGQARVKALQEEQDRLQGQLAAAQTALDDHPAVDLVVLEAAVTAARNALTPAKAAVTEAQDRLRRAEQARADAVAAYDRSVAAVASAQATLKIRKQELKDLAFNNALLKAVRAARPTISDKLWNMVLGAVSRYFSDMRGQPSLVTKTPEGFMVDNHLVSPATLSGSALDILGLAIRVALVKTFLPACPFFVLDEPAQGCDDNRTVNLLGFLAGCGFQQVLLVTHEDTSESVAQNIITIGEKQ